MLATQKLYLTANKKALVAEGDRRAAFLYAVPGDEIPDESAKRFGLKDGALKGAKKGGASKPAGGSDGGKDAKPKGIKDIAGIGPASIKLLADNDVKSVEDLAAVDPAQLAQVEGLPPAADPTAWVVAAKAMQAAAKAEG